MSVITHHYSAAAGLCKGSVLLPADDGRRQRHGQDQKGQHACGEADGDPQLLLGGQRRQPGVAKG